MSPNTSTEDGILEQLTTYAVIGYKLFEVARLTLVNMRLVPKNATSLETLAVMSKWSKEMLDSLGGTVEVIGEPPPWGVLQVSNHRSYMDILILASQSPGHYVAKADIADWPILGPAAKLGGSIFVQRDDKDSRRSVRETLQEQLALGKTMNVFPEGTTEGPPGTLPFKVGAFVTAINTGAKVALTAIEYPEASDAWVDQEPAGQHFMRVHRHPKRVRLSFGPVLDPADFEDAKELSLAAKAWIDEELDRLGDFSKPL